MMIDNASQPRILNDPKTVLGALLHVTHISDWQHRHMHTIPRSAASLHAYPVTCITAKPTLCSIPTRLCWMLNQILLMLS